jgi:hypothetical protein
LFISSAFIPRAKSIVKTFNSVDYSLSILYSSYKVMASVNPSLLVNAAVPAFKCPAGTKMHVLNLGTLQADESWFVQREIQDL